MKNYALLTALLVIGCGGEPFSYSVAAENSQSNDSGKQSDYDSGVQDDSGNKFDSNVESDVQSNDSNTQSDAGLDSQEDTGFADAANDVESDVQSNDSNTQSDAGLDSQEDTGFADAANDVESQNDSGLCSNDLQGDPLNCGYCNHSCEGGQCIDGDCKPFSLAYADNPGDIIGYNGDIYWIHSGGLSKVSKYGGQVSSVSNVNGTLGSIVVQDNILYFASQNTDSIYRYDTSVSTVASGVNSVHSIAADSNYIYAIEFVAKDSPSNSILKVSVNGGTIQRLASPNSPRHIAVDDTNIYFGDLEYKAVLFMSKSSNGFVLLSEENHPRKLFTYDGFVYWGNASPPNLGVYRIEKTGAGNKQSLFSSGNAWGIFIANEYVYWTDNQVGTVNRVPVFGGANEVIVDSQYGPHNVYADEHAVYWSNRGNNSVMKVVL